MEWLESVRGLSEGDRGVVFRMNEEERRCFDSHENSLESIEEEPNNVTTVHGSIIGV